MEPRLTQQERSIPAPLLLAGMALGMLLIYRTVSLPLIGVGLVIFGALAFTRPGLALLFIPLTVPWYLSPVYIPDIRASGFVLPLSEVLLLTTLGATLARLTIDVVRGQIAASSLKPRASSLRLFLPQILFLVAGMFGVALAIERGPALRDFRWMVIEPLIFYAMIRWQLRRDPAYARQITAALIASGTFVALLGILQFFGVDLVPVLLSPTKSFADSVVPDEGVSRIASVYGHPNNLGMFLGRVWPLAAALAAGAQSAERVIQNSKLKTQNSKLKTPLLVFCLVVCLGGLFVSFSRGAWLGAGVALAVLAIGWVLGASIGSRTRALARWALPVGLLVAFAIMAGVVLTLRGGVVGGSTPPRLLIWGEALQFIRLHPLGLGLDQFYYYHNPEFGRNLIDPALLPPSDWYAKHPHNLILELWLLLTPLGLVAVVWLLMRFARRGVAAVCAAPRREAGLLALGALASMAAALTHGLVDTFYFWPDIAFTFWLLLALVDGFAADQAGVY